MTNYFKKLEQFLSEYKLVIGIMVMILLATLCVMTYFNFQKQNEIIETGGYTDGKIRCVCNEEAWVEYEKSRNLEVPTIVSDNG